MYYFDSTRIDGDIFLHLIGNKSNEETLVLSNSPLNIEVETERVFQHYFLSHFKQPEYFCFNHEASLSMNEVYNYVSAIFDDITELKNQSKYIAKTLYRKSVHPNIKSGELYVVHFRNCLVEGEMVDAVGLFKSENKEPFIKVRRVGNTFEVSTDRGTNINKLDKACLVFNIQRDNGYLALVVDNSNKGEAKYWVDDFLNVRAVNDCRVQTKELVSMYKHFINRLPDNINKMERAVMMNRVVEELNGKEISVEQLPNSFFESEKISEEFSRFKDEYQKENNLVFDAKIQCDTKPISRRFINSITTIKLDSNFEISILGDQRCIETGYDELRGMNFYKLYFNEEK